jgi:hypothetical protein
MRAACIADAQEKAGHGRFLLVRFLSRERKGTVQSEKHKNPNNYAFSEAVTSDRGVSLNWKTAVSVEMTDDRRFFCARPIDAWPASGPRLNVLDVRIAGRRLPAAGTAAIAGRLFAGTENAQVALHQIDDRQSDNDQNDEGFHRLAPLKA